ncbi:MAG TPA: DUF1572 family protein [Tepidisphaeraceae bacterium]|jgi:uncharacterized damage-inducible protein DinB|nr:DUF1572 family protein [Tepidisphaeraceae bacterium]
MISIGRMFIDDQRARLAHTRQRITGVINQLSDEDLNWRPNPESNSVTNLVIHICGNLKQRYGHHIAGDPDSRDRSGEFDTAAHRTKAELLASMEDAFATVDAILERLPLASLFDLTQIRGENRSTLDIIASSSAHTAEHLGQIIYIAKIRLGPRYQYLLKL